MTGYRIAAGDARPSGARAALLTGRPCFHGDVEGEQLVNPDMVAVTGAKSVAFEPVRAGGRTAAVLVVGWRTHVPQLGSREREMVAIAAGEAAVALLRLQALRRLEDAALTDPMTGVANRRAFDARLPLELSRSRRGGRPLAMALIDLNDFKALNDRDGHEDGDRLLRAAAAAWSGELRDTDVLARIGGDEFAILLPDCDEPRRSPSPSACAARSPMRPAAASGGPSGTAPKTRRR